jgi:isocitrate dehydrogenase kinase/phosphatase
MSNGSVSSALTDSRLAALCAQAVRESFLEYEKQFHEITRGARERFLARDWAGSFADASARLHLYTNVLDDLTATIKKLMGPRLAERNVWTAIKAVYSSLIVDTPAWEIAESFFNSLTRRVFATEGVDQAIEFVDTDFDAPPVSKESVCRIYAGSSLDKLLINGLTDAAAGGFAEECWDDLGSTAGLAAQRLETAFAEAGGKSLPGKWQLELIESAFYRARGAYYVGCLSRDTEPTVHLPIALCLRHPSKGGITLDAVLRGDSDLAILFSYTRAYFRVDARCPHRLVRYLEQLMPRKRRVDLYNAIGFHRHGKTEFYRDFVAHLRESTDQFTTAEGALGMVMVVFTLPSYDVVFKLIKDHFDFPKDTTRKEVMRRYRLVFEHDRAGRLIEAHEFEHLRIPLERFDTRLLKQLRCDAADTVRVEGDDVVIGHAYVERRIRPLNIFFGESDDASAAAAACDYGLAIKDLAASNIFPGDLLTKNFGVTRNERVVFYDYDELCFLTDCNFRDLPQSTTYEEEIAAEPWFSVRENDIFPEEFPRFLSMPESARQALLEQHGDLFRAEFWREVQGKLRGGEIPEIFPYAAERRLNAR